MKYLAFGLWLTCVLSYFGGAVVLMWQTAIEANTHLIHTNLYNGVQVLGVVIIRCLLIGLVVIILNHYTTKGFEKLFGRKRIFPF
jgi:hypothetical protein